MNCPYCDTPNDTSNQFCISCGRALHGQATSPEGPVASSASEYLVIMTLRFLIALLGLALLNMILTGLAFVEELTIPDFPISTPTLVSSLIYLIALVLLANYARMLAIMWPQAFPRYQEASVVFVALILLIILTTAYSGFRPFILEYANDTTPLTIIQFVFLVVAFIIVGRASVILYQALPSWLAGLRWSSPSDQIASSPKEEEQKSSKNDD